jgi:sugar/nucleoside kinase (ribokinase family)
MTPDPIWDVVGVGANSIDFVYRLPNYPAPDSPFAKVPITEHLISCGGQVATALATCAAMGLSTSYIGTIGSDRQGARMREELKRRSIDTAHAIARNASNPFAVIVLDDRQGERVVLWRRDPEIALTPNEIDRETIAAARLVHVDDVDLEASVEAANLARAAGKPVTSDVERTNAEVRPLIEAVTIPIFAEHVPAALTGEHDVERALRRLRLPHHTMMCVTLGVRGALLLVGNQIIREPGVSVKTVDTTGAGDIFRGAFIYALLRGDSPRDIVRFANTAAALSCTRVGAMSSIPTVDETQGFGLQARGG